MSSSSGGSESTASMKEGAAETTPNMDPNASMTNGEHHHHHHHNHHEEAPEEDPVPAQEPKEEEEEEEDMESATEIKQQIQQSPENRMASVITINGSEAGCDHEVAYVEMNNGMGSGRSERSGFDNPAFVDDEARGKGSGGGKVVNGGGRLSPPSSPPPRPPSPAGPFLNSVVATTPPPPGGANGRGPIMETPNSNIHNNSGLIMTPSEKEKSDIDGCTNVTEAVNLELVNMNPYGGAGLGIGDEVAGGKSGTNGGLNGIPVKRGAGDEETGDGGFGDPYDEYFVPVNEHRKYMRGEKLYVTKDRRRSQSWRRCICWGVGFTLLAVAILIAVLAGTGVILSQEEDVKSVESRGFSDHIPHVAESRDPNAPVEKEPIPTDLPPEPSSSFTPPPSMSSVPVNPPTTEMSGLNVPRVLEADMRIDGMEFTSDLENSNSSRYKELASILGDELKLALFDDHTLRNGPADIFVKVVGFSPGSVVSKFHVGWRFKDSFPTARDPIDMESLKDRLEAYLLNHGGYLHTYRISSGSVTSTHVMDMCQIGNGGCSHECRYDYEEAKFMCNCPPGLFLEQTGKKCTTELIDDTTSTKGPFFDESPWMPMQPKEPTPVDEVAKHDEAGRDAAGEETHGEEDKHGEMEDHDKMHEDHHSHVQPTDPAEDEDHNNMHEEHHTPIHPMHPVEAEMESEDSPVSGEEEHETNDSMNEGERKEMHEDERPVDEHHEERQFIPSVGTGRSSGDDMVLVEHSSEEPREEHDAENDTEHDEYSHFGREEEKNDEKSVESEEKHPSSREEMEKLGHSVDSSENTSEEVHDSAEVPHSREESDYDDVMGGRDMSEGGEVTNDYHSSVHSLSNELHGPISESTTSENPHYNGLESHESGDHEGSEVGEHVHASSTAAPDAHETFNETDHHMDGWPLKGEIISAVGHVIVKNENETAESTSHEQDESMEHNWESGVARENANESSHEMEEVVAHVVMDGEEMDNKGGDTAEHSSEEGMTDEKITEHKEEGMPDSAEDKMVDDMEKEVAAEPHDMETSEHMKDDMEKEVAVEPHDMETPEHMKEEMPEDRGEDEMEHKDEGMKSSVLTVNSSGEEEHKEEGLMETKEENMATHEEVPEDKGDGVEDNVTSEGKDEHEEGHVPVVVVMHGENDVGNHEENPKPVESHEVPAEGDGRENGREMDEKTKEKSQEEVMVHSTETTFGSDGHEMDLTAMNHEKPVMENDGSKENEHMDHNFGIPAVMMEHPVSEENVTTETEASTAATGENEADIVNEKHNEKEEGPWGMNNEAREVGEHAHSTEGQEMEAKEHVVNEMPVVEKEVVMKDHEENTMMPEEKMKETEDGTVVTDKISEQSMEKPSAEEESSTAKMEGPETMSTHADNLTNVLEGNDEEGVKKVSEEEPKIESASAVPEEEMHKPDNHDVDDVSTPIPKAVILSEDEDPNIVPVEETPKEMADDDNDAKKSILSDMRIVGLDKEKDTATGMQNDTEMLMARENNEGSSVINLTSVSEGSNASENHEGVSKMPMDHEMEVSMSSSTTSPGENSIENLSDHYNSTDGANITPSAENDHIEHLVVPVIVMNESSTVMTTPSPKENNIDDPPLHVQAGIPMMASEEPSTSTTESAIVNDLLLPGHDASASPKETTEKEESTDEKIAELDRIEKVIDDMEEKLKEEVAKDEEHPSSMSTEATTSEKSSEKEEKMMKDDKVDAEKVDVEVSGEKTTEGEGREKPNSDSKEEMSSITTVHQDFTVEHANTVHAINPTSPSTTIEETPKEESMSDSTVPKTLESIDLEETVTKDENRAPEPHLPFETDDNERSNNLATLDNEDSLTVPEGGNEAVVKVGAVDAGPKSTTEHTNEILAVPVYQSSWPSTALEANNLTKAQKDSEITPEGHQTESSALKEKEDVTKMGAFEIPMKKKGEFKKPIHHEDEITKPLFGKEGKESTNKVDKIGLLPVISTSREDSSEEMNSEEVDSLMVTTTEMSSVTQQNMETVSGSSTEAGATLSTSPADKGGEKLNAIGEDDSGIKKDLGKAVAKETVKDVQESITVKSETTEKDASHENEEKSAIDSMLEPESTTQEMVDHKAVAMDEHKDEAKEVKEDITTMNPNSDKVAEMLEVHPTEMVVKEEETTATSDSSSSPKKDDEEGMVKEMDEAVTVKEAAVGESEETMTKMSVAEETVTPTSTEAPREKVEELLKDMGGYGEGGHKVVSKSGVELTDGHKEIHQERTTTEALNVVVSASSTLMASSTTSLPTPSPPMTEAEKSSPTTLPPESETTKVEVNNEVEEKSTKEEMTHDQMDGSKSENATSEDPIPTMMIHEIVPSISLSSTSLPVESPSSTASSVESVALPSKESEETTVVEEVSEITTVNAVPEVAAVTTLSPDSVGVTMPPHVSEILVKDETSSFAGKDSVKEVASVNVTEPSLEKDKAEGSVTEKAAVEEDHATSNATASAFPEIDQQYFSKCTAGQFQCANGTSLTPYSVTPISSSYVASLATGVACVPLSAKCDSINDCSDGSDELGCIEEGCPGNFQCSNGQCLKRHLVCNGIVDCNDASDEANCETWKCQFDEFQCPSGRCIPVLWQCDGKPDCDNHTDEYTCQDSCGNNEYLCPERWCIPMSWRCNGVPECANGEDEKLCDCSLEQVKCGTGGCVARSEICDGVDQCPDQSDEWGCVRLHNETMKLEVRTTENEWLSVCGDNWDTSWSNFVCQSFGYSRAVFTEYPSAGDLDGSSEVFTLKPEASVTSPPGNSMRLPGVLQRVSPSVCSSGSIVEISCQEFTCGNHGLADGVAARLVGGDEAANGQWPSVALLYHTRQRATCTASIISPRWLIASYNCLHMREKSLTPEGWVAFGGGSTFDKDKPETQIRTVRSIVPYPQVKYNRFLYNHDVALVELVQPMTFTRSVGAICLPDKPIEPRQLCVTAGWGYTSPGEINFSQYLHYLPVPTIDLSECNSTKHYSGFITEDKICAGFTDAMHSPCYNDEGAPLMCVSEGGIWELQGVLSYHSNCGRGYHPSIFSSVTAVRDWVKRVVGGRFERRSTFNVRRRRRTKRRRNSDINERATSIIWT